MQPDPWSPAPSGPAWPAHGAPVPPGYDAPVPPGYGYGPPPPPHTPGPVVALRILAWIQVGLLAVGVGLAVIVVAVASTGLSSDDDLTQGFAGLGVILGLVFAVFAVVLVLLVAVPTALLRTGRHTGKLGALITLTVVESILAALSLIRAVGTAAGRDPAGAVVPFVSALFPAAIVVLAMLPVTLAWASQPSGPPPPGPYPG